MIVSVQTMRQSTENLTFDAQAAHLMSKAEIMLREACRFDAVVAQKDGSHVLLAPHDEKHGVVTEAHRRAYARMETLAQARINGSRASVRQRIRAEASAREMRLLNSTQRANLAQANAMNDRAASYTAIEVGLRAREGAAFDGKAFLDIHRSLFAGTERAAMAGCLRTDDTQLGGDRFHKAGAPYRTPKCDEIPALLDEAARYCQIDLVPALVQAALAHNLLLAVNPFERGNGKVAAAAVQLVFARRGITTGTIVPISLGLITRAHEFRDLVSASIDDLGTGEHDGLMTWVEFYAAACVQAAENMRKFDCAVQGLQDRWVHELAPRADSATLFLLLALPGMPALTANMARERIGRSPQRVASAIDELLEAGVIVQISEGKRNRVFEAPTLMNAYESFRGLE